MKKVILIVLLFTTTFVVNSQTEKEQIKEALLHYIEGTANGEPDRVQKAFHKDLNLYSIRNGALAIWKGDQYIGNIKSGKKSNRIGKIISIDYENNAAMAKLEIDMPGAKRVYTDYMLLLKIKGVWKVIHKSYTFRPYKK
jgi:hypothetical protein